MISPQAGQSFTFVHFGRNLLESVLPLPPCPLAPLPPCPLAPLPPCPLAPLPPCPLALLPPCPLAPLPPCRHLFGLKCFSLLALPSNREEYGYFSAYLIASLCMLLAVFSFIGVRGRYRHPEQRRYTGVRGGKKVQPLHLLLYSNPK